MYHPYHLWEDYKAGFYDNCTGDIKKQKENLVIEMFNDASLTEKYMNRVIDDWFYSCQHNLTNESMNKIAYIGQGACCIFAAIPSTITMSMWSKLDKKVQERSDKIAEKVLNKWLKRNRNIQLCLKLI